MKTLPERKPLRLKGYDYSTPGAYFITICTHDRKQLLSKIVMSNTLVGAIHESPKIGCDVTGAIHESPSYTIQKSPSRPIPEIRLTQYDEITKQIIEMLPRRFNISIPKYVIMPNHIHLIIEIGCNVMGAIRESPLQQANRHRSIIDKTIGFMKMNVSKAINVTYNGKIWQRSYHDHIIRDQKDYSKIWEYIDTNPARWEEDCFYDSVENNTFL